MQTQSSAAWQQGPGPGPAIAEFPPRNPEGFDLRVHIRNAKTGNLIRLQHYAIHCDHGVTMLEQPIGSGNMYQPNGQPMGRWEDQRERKGRGSQPHWVKVSEDHAHVDHTFYANREEELEDRNKKLQARIAELEAQAIAADQAAKLQTESHEPKNEAKAAEHAHRAEANEAKVAAAGTAKTAGVASAPQKK